MGRNKRERSTAVIDAIDPRTGNVRVRRVVRAEAEAGQQARESDPAAASPFFDPLATPGVNWNLLRTLAAKPSFNPDVYGSFADRKPHGFKSPTPTIPVCPGCGAKWGGDVVCGICRNRVKRLRELLAKGADVATPDDAFHHLIREPGR